MRQKLATMLAEEQQIIAHNLTQVTRDPELVEAEIRARLLRQIIKMLPENAIRPDWVEPHIINEVPPCNR
jgi:hypothetical protein